MPPAMRRRRRDAEGGRGRLQRKTILDRADEREPTSQSELGVSVQIHPPSFERESGKTHSLEGGPDRPQPFTTSVGSSTSGRTPLQLAMAPIGAEVRSLAGTGGLRELYVARDLVNRVFAAEIEKRLAA